MITNTGKTILAKYLIGQAPAYASHIALGVGPKPLNTTDAFDDYSEKDQLDFEVVRIPITSKGYVYDEDGSSNIVFAGELPGDQRYLFSEIGVFSARSNPSAGVLSSKNIYTFGESENWEYHDEVSAVSIPFIVEPLDSWASSGTIDNLVDQNGDPAIAFRASSDNAIFSGTRLDSFEQPRFLDKALFIPGDMSYLDSVGGNLEVVDDPIEYYGSHIHLTGIAVDFNKNSSQDELRLAFSVVGKTVADGESLGGVRIMIEFASTDAINPDNYARFELDLGAEEFNTSKYVVATKRLGDLIKSTSFTWNTINSVKIYATAYDNTSTTPSSNYYIALDGFRLENVTAQNPLYGLTGYTVVKTDDGLPIKKEQNSSNIVEFRYGMDVV